jgi:salicylate hydroxylase
LKPSSVDIVGAGLGGLVAALALQRAGWQVRVHEQAPTLGEAGAGISLSSGAGLGLASLGLGRAVLAASLPAPAVAFVHYRTGALLAGSLDGGAPEDRGFHTARHIHRADLHAILLAAVRANDEQCVQPGRRLVALGKSGAEILLHFADGTTTRSRLVIGADGTRSVVRRMLFDAADPRFAGQLAFRCLLPAQRAEPFLAGGNALVTVGPARIFHRYRIRGGELVNVVAIARSERWEGEGWSRRAGVDELAQAYGDFGADVRGLIRVCPPETLIKWGLFVRDPLPRWHSGPVVLLGDAAHPILPFLGLGAALAIEDAIVLARALERGASLISALEAYRTARIDRVEDVRIRSIAQGEIVQAADPDGAGLGASPSQDPRLFDYDPCTVPIHA